MVLKLCKKLIPLLMPVAYLSGLKGGGEEGGHLQELSNFIFVDAFFITTMNLSVYVSTTTFIMSICLHHHYMLLPLLDTSTITIYSQTLY
jgi:hypothetical protein